MDASMQHKSPARLDELSPFNIRLDVEGAHLLRPDTSAAHTAPPETGATLESEYGCVDWFRYPDRQLSQNKPAE